MVNLPRPITLLPELPCQRKGAPFVPFGMGPEPQQSLGQLGTSRDHCHVEQRRAFAGRGGNVPVQARSVLSLKPLDLIHQVAQVSRKGAPPAAQKVLLGVSGPQAQREGGPILEEDILRAAEAVEGDGPGVEAIGPGSRGGAL